MKYRQHIVSAGVIIAMAVAWMGLAQERGASDIIGERPIKDFVVHTEQFMLKGDQAFSRANGLVRVEGITVETREEGKTNLIATTPAAIYDEGRTNIRSASAISVRSADDMFLLSGEGFSLFPELQHLTLLSNVVTRFDRRFFSQASDSSVTLSSNSSAPLSVIASQFIYNGRNGDAEYRNGVRFSDGERLSMRAGLTKFNVADLTNEVRMIQAIDDVVIELEMSNKLATAMSHEAILERYPDVDARVTLVGSPTWKYDLVSGAAGLIELVVISNQFDVLGTNQATMRFPTTMFATNVAENAATDTETAWVDIGSAYYRFTPGLLSFNRGVTVTQSTNWSARANQMLAHLNPTNQSPIRLDAMGEFRFAVNQEKGRGSGRADNAVFERIQTNRWQALLSGEPFWESEELSTTATTIRVIDPMGEQEIFAEGDARLVLSGDLLSGLNWFDKNNEQEKGTESVDEMEPITITSDNYDLNSERVVFVGDVLVRQSTNSLAAPELTIWFTPERRASKLFAERGVTAKSGPHTLFAQTLTAFFDGPENTASEVRAEEDVEFSDADIHAVGESLVYVAATSEIVLDGDPSVIATRRESEENGDEDFEHIRRVRLDAPKITLNLTNNNVFCSAPYLVQTLPLDDPAEIKRP